MRFAVFIVVLLVLSLLALYVMGDQTHMPVEQKQIDIDITPIDS